MAVRLIAAVMEKTMTSMSSSARWLCMTLIAVGLTLFSVAAFAQGTPARLPKGFTEKIANVDGVKINYKTGGRGPVVVLLHGYTQTSHMWIPLMPLLAASHTVIAPDLRGAGNSERAKAGYDKKRWQKTSELSCADSAMTRCNWSDTILA